MNHKIRSYLDITFSTDFLLDTLLYIISDSTRVKKCVTFGKFTYRKSLGANLLRFTQYI